jgi:hypothetical protein
MTRTRDSNIPISQLGVGPIRHAALPETLVERIKAVAETFVEVDPRPVEEWVEDFQRDMHPEKEIALWEVMAGAYALFTHGRTLTPTGRKEVFALILQRSMADAKTVIRNVRLAELSRKDAKAILRYFFQVADAKGVSV